MNNQLLLSILFVALWTIFVIYCLFNGSKVKVISKRIKVPYWILTAISVDLALYMINGLSIMNIILMLVMLLVTSLYLSIPSGYNEEGIFIRGICFPYKKIEDMGIEHILSTNRLNFKCYYRILYIDSDSYAELKECERLYKRVKNYD